MQAKVDDTSLLDSAARLRMAIVRTSRRLRPEALAVHVGGASIAELGEKTVEELDALFALTDAPADRAPAAV